MMIKHKLRTTIKKVNGDCLTPVLIFNRLQGTQKFLLESSAKHETTGRYSFIGANPRKTYIGSGTTLTEISHLTGKCYSYEGDLVRSLKQVMPRVSNHTEYPFTGGAIGYIRFNREQSTIPAVNFQVYDTIVIYDHVKDELTVVHTNIDAEMTEPNIDDIIDQILNGTATVPGAFSLGAFTEQTAQQQFDAQVEAAQQLIAAGENAEIVLSRKLQADFSGDTFSLYRELRVKLPSPYMYYIEFSDHTVIGASPKSVVSVYDGQLKTTTTTDVEAICPKESIQYDGATISGTLSPTLHAIDALTHLLPADRVTGKPKEAAAKAIQSIEQEQRALYGGAIGYIGFNGQIDFALACRTLLMQQDKAITEIGATVTASSKAKELYETTNAQALLQEEKG